jgi:hypothetical protein
MQITLNSLSLTSSNIVSSDISGDDAPTPDNNLLQIYRRDRSKLVSRQFTKKTITIMGTLVCGSATELLSVIDAIKAAASTLDAVLDVTYDSGEVRRYITNIGIFPVPRKAHNIMSVPFTLELVAADPIAVTPTYVDINFSLASVDHKTQALSLLGTYYPEPIITITFSSGVSSVVIGNDYLGQAITLGSVTTSDIIVVDISKKQVTKNSVVIDYTGVFPTFNYGTNNLTITLGSSGSCTVNVHYQPRWL